MSHYPDSYEFGPFQFHSTKRILTRAGESIPLRPKASEVLFLLIANAGQLVEKNELLKEVWPNTFVEESNLTQNIFTLRKVLGDGRAEPKYIETVTRRGYRFVAPVKAKQVFENDRTKWKDGDLPSAAAGNGRPVIAVLPFVNVNNDPKLDSLASCLTDKIINNLSRVPDIHVMSRSAVLRYRIDALDPQHAGKELSARAVLLGKISATPGGVLIDVELVDSATGWQLWGESYNPENEDTLRIQETITQQLLANLKRKFGSEENKSIARYTENTQAYQSYLVGRQHCSSYTRKGIEIAIGHFKQAIELDPNYALAYSGIIDCYLRLATNYLPPEEDVLLLASEMIVPKRLPNEPDPMVKLRFEWDWKTSERELRRANELQTNFPTANQWYAAYKISRQLYEETLLTTRHRDSSATDATSNWSELILNQIASCELTSNEKVHVQCAISRDQMDAGNYEAACRILRPWWSFGNWPKLEGLSQPLFADLLFTCGELAGCVASTLQILQGQRHAEELLNGSIALFEQLGSRRRAAEGRIELALCYYRQGLFDVGRTTLLRVLQQISDDDFELHSLALFRLAIVERHAGRLKDSLARLVEANLVMEPTGPWLRCRYHLELASTYKDLAISEQSASYFDFAKDFYFKALHELQAIGNHRYVGIVENNIGFLLLSIGLHQEAEKHLIHSRKLFEGLSDIVRAAQVDETLARLYVAMEQSDLAQLAINRAVQTLELTDGEALLAEALTTHGLVGVKSGRYTEAKKSFEAAYRIAERCGDYEGAGRALLVLLEEASDRLDITEKLDICDRLRKLLSTTQQTALQNRVNKALARIIQATAT